jgi:hydroxymethylglutaryl-CoA reductase
MEIVSGFSKLSKDQKIDWLKSQVCSNNIDSIKYYWHQEEDEQKVFDDFSENTVGNFYLPFGLAPNFIIDSKTYTIPMVIEESSVVAAASKSAKFWSTRGGFKTQIISTTKSGQVHFKFMGSTSTLFNFFSLNKSFLLSSCKELTANMEKRGGGIKSLELIDKSSELSNYYQLDAKFETCDAMGANFINSILEKLGETFRDIAQESIILSEKERDIEIIMCILSNYTPECTVRAWVECAVEELGVFGDMKSEHYANKFYDAIQISKIDRTRAVTHNKGIFNGIDAVVIATGNDFRATSACGHAYAAKDGTYRGLSSCTISEGRFLFEITIPLSIGTVGGLTSLHPMARTSLDILDKPSAKQLMSVIACAGLAQNFGAITSLVTTGIQKGHMKMHLLNILNQLNATQEQIESAKSYFSDRSITFSEVRNFLNRSLH